MVKKEICDVCGKEIPKLNICSLVGFRWSIFLTKIENKDFCSTKCLKKFVGGL